MVRFQVALLAVCATAAAAVDIVVHEKGGTKIRAPYGLMHEVQFDAIADRILKSLLT
jgi:hypothetical protein